MRLQFEEKNLEFGANRYDYQLLQIDRRRQSQLEQNHLMMEDYAAFIVRNKETIHLMDVAKKQNKPMLRGNVPIQKAVVDKQTAVTLRLSELSNTTGLPRRTATQL